MTDVFTPEFLSSLPDSFVLFLSSEELAGVTNRSKSGARYQAEKIDVFPRIIRDQVYTQFDTSNFAINGYRTVRRAEYQITVAQLKSIVKN